MAINIMRLLILQPRSVPQSQLPLPTTVSIHEPLPLNAVLQNITNSNFYIIHEPRTPSFHLVNFNRSIDLLYERPACKVTDRPCQNEEQKADQCAVPQIQNTAH